MGRRKKEPRSAHRAKIAAAASELKNNGDEELFVVTCFSDRDKILSRVEKEA